MSEKMFVLRELTNYPVPYPQKEVGEFRSLDELRRAMRFSDSEISQALAGQPVRERWVVDFSESYLTKLAIDEVLEASDDGRLHHRDIAELLGISEENSRYILHQALKKLKKSPDAIAALLEAAAIRREMHGEYHTKIRITIS